MGRGLCVGTSHPSPLGLGRRRCPEGPLGCGGAFTLVSVLWDGRSGHTCECGTHHEGMTKVRGWGIREFGQGEQIASDLTHYSSGAEPDKKIGPSFLQHRPLSIVKR